MSTNVEVRNTITWAVTINTYTWAWYTHNQVTSSATWTITHNLGYYPNVQIEDSWGDSIIPQKIIQNSVNQITIEFQGSMAGKAYIS